MQYTTHQQLPCGKLLYIYDTKNKGNSLVFQPHPKRIEPQQTKSRKRKGESREKNKWIGFSLWKKSQIPSGNLPNHHRTITTTTTRRWIEAPPNGLFRDSFKRLRSPKTPHLNLSLLLLLHLLLSTKNPSRSTTLRSLTILWKRTYPLIPRSTRRSSSSASISPALPSLSPGYSFGLGFWVLVLTFFDFLFLVWIFHLLSFSFQVCLLMNAYRIWVFVGIS